MNIAWLTDIHLNFLKVEGRKKFYQQVIETGADRILITGDIAEAKDVCEILQEFSTYTNKPIDFVLGNHDYYFSSVNNVREKVCALCAQNRHCVRVKGLFCYLKVTIQTSAIFPRSGKWLSWFSVVKERLIISYSLVMPAFKNY